MRAPPRSSRGRPSSSGERLPARGGCLGAVLGLLAAAGVLLLAGLWTAYVGPLSSLGEADPSKADITITVQEAFLDRVVARSLPDLPSGLATEVALDLRPGARIAFRVRLSSKLLNQNLAGDATGTVYLDVVDGQLALRVSDLKVLGFSLPAIGQTLLDEFSSRLNRTINDQIRAAMGRNTVILDLTTDETQMVLRARWRQ